MPLQIRTPKIFSHECRICDVPTKSSYLGVISCHACKMFFKRNAKATFICDYDGLCEININTRHVCSACRLAKCFQCGMTTDKLQSTRHNKPKTNALAKKQVQYQPTKLPTLNLLSSDQSLLTTDQWTLLRNLFNCYQESQIIPFSQRLIDTYDIAQSNYITYQTLVDEFLASIYKTAEIYLCSNDDLRKLSSDNRYVILRSAADNVCCMGGAFIVLHCRLNLLDAFLNTLTI
ncbi:unnamed protein product, partial [Rotaria sp. Silwood1]